jgi:hypothetical protein
MPWRQPPFVQVWMCSSKIVQNRPNPFEFVQLCQISATDVYGHQITSNSVRRRHCSSKSVHGKASLRSSSDGQAFLDKLRRRIFPELAQDTDSCSSRDCASNDPRTPSNGAEMGFPSMGFTRLLRRQFMHFTSPGRLRFKSFCSCDSE